MVSVDSELLQRFDNDNPHYPYKIWIKRDFPYRCPSFEYQQTPVKSRRTLRQCVNLYLPMHSWSPQEQTIIEKEVDLLYKESWNGMSQSFSSSSSVSNRGRDQQGTWDISMVGKRPMIFYVVGGSWMMGNRAQANVHDMLKTMCRNLNAICVSIGYRVCRLQTRYLDLTLFGMSLFCFINVWLFSSNAKGLYFKTTWILMGLFFLFLLIVCQILRNKPNNLHPVPLHDVAAGMKWSYFHSSRIGGDYRNVALAAHSAGAHLITLLFANPVSWLKTQIPRQFIRAIVAISGVYSAECMRNDFMYRGIGRLVFGDDSELQWNDYFPCEVIAEYPDIHWPKVLLLTAQFDYGMRKHSSCFYDILYQNDKCEELRWITIKQVNHFSITCFWSYQHHPIATFVCDFLDNAFVQSRLPFS
jgi:acetyl esterase/lipase